MHISYMMLSGPMDPKKWHLLRQRGILLSSEIEKLEQQDDSQLLVYTWVVTKLDHLQRNEKVFPHYVNTMERCFGYLITKTNVQQSYSRTQLPFIYYHSTACATTLFLCCQDFTGALAISYSLTHSCVESLDAENSESGICWSEALVIFNYQMFLMVITTSLLCVATHFSECFESSLSTYDLGFDLDSLWETSAKLLMGYPTVEAPKATEAFEFTAVKDESIEDRVNLTSTWNPLDNPAALKYLPNPTFMEDSERNQQIHRVD
eukprot:gene10978-12985_t